MVSSRPPAPANPTHNRPADVEHTPQFAKRGLQNSRTHGGLADVLTEDPDLYRWLGDSSAQLGVPITRVADGRTPWQLFHDVHYLGNSRIAPCTVTLKIRPCRRWLDAHADPASTTLYIGLDASPRDRRRAPAIATGWRPWTSRFPLLDPPQLTKQEQLDYARQLGLHPPRLYDLGLPHNNCGGACVRAGKHHWARLLHVLPDHYAAAEAAENQLRNQLGNVTILTEQRQRQRHRLPLSELRRRLTSGHQP
ncbi:hypothetical protein [Micromonospora aurantiaca (nom. illeg.)]|uniref:hypothetical protein n=1 Tax=Micromonospora aurantiaca (nom. illeg.) TaxID=47850 RepID=UPI0001BF4FAA|nr:hypothetical protein Micau_4141 [Micromonospora aurantiaca ATCC 27029]